MAESNATQVILTDDGIKIINAQRTANNAAGGVTNLNDPNLMSVIEKQTQASRYAGLTSQYNVILKRAKDANISTTALTTAYTKLNTFMVAILTDTTKASDVNRDTYKRLTDAYNSALSKVQTALSNSFNNDIDNMHSSILVASQAASNAVIVASQAAITGDNASQVASRAIVAANDAQSAGNNATSVANKASQATSSAIVAGSTATVNADKAVATANQAKTAGDNATNVANKASQAASSAIVAGSTATVNADKAVVVANQAKTAGDNAANVANKASQVASSAIVAGSTATVNADKAVATANDAKTAGDNATSVASKASQAASNAVIVGSTAAVSASQASADYQKLSTGVKDGSVVHITTKTVIDEGVIGTAEIVNGAITNAKIGDASINSAKIASLAVGTAQIGDGAITNAKIGKLAVGTAQIANAAITDAQIGNEAVGTAQIKDAAINSAKIDSLAVGTAQIGDAAITDAKIGKLAVGTAQIKDGAITNVQIGSEAVGTAQIGKEAVGTAQIAHLAVGTAQIGDGAITNAKIDKLAVGTAQIANGAITEAQISKLAVGTAQIKYEAVGTAQIAHLAVGTAQIGDGAITNAKIGKLAVGTAQIANAAITDAQIGNVSANKLTAGTIDFNTITGKNINASNITTGILNTDRLNVNKLSALSADLGDVTTGSLKGVNIIANTFSTPNGSFKTDASGAITAKNMALIGGTLTSPTINASTINGSTINGTTFNAGDIISSTYNTSRFYPTTITPDGLVATTGFNSMDGLRTEMSAGSFVTKYRAIHSSSNQYEAYDGVFSGDELALNSGFTNGIDMGFQQSVSGNQLTGQVVLSPLDGIHLWGSTQSIHFSGLQMNGTGITFNSYGNIIADQASTWWRIGDVNGNQIVNFGTDSAGSNTIQFKRNTEIGNLFLGTGHTIQMLDGKPLYFRGSNDKMLEIHAGDVHYTSLVKSSLLSVKRDVQKADTAYWAQLVNSIDLATYQYKTDDNTSHIRLSSIVDDVNDTKQWQLPDVFISRDENGKLSGVDDSVLLNATLATVQEQQKEIDQLNGHNMELEARLNKLEAKLNG